VWGGITGGEISKYLGGGARLSDVPQAAAVEEEKRIFSGLLNQSGTESPARIRRELRTMMDQHAGVFRSGGSMREGLGKIAALKERFAKIGIQDKSRIYNTNLIQALETENMLELAEAVLFSGLAREESRGAHSRTDFSVRDDVKFLAHSMAFRTGEGPRLEYKPVTITTWKPVERKY
jgi:succinate dehydrogenase / fumarate reductase flavoprotein subunit